MDGETETKICEIIYSKSHAYLLMAEQNQDQSPKILNSGLIFFSLFAFIFIHYLPKTC